MASSIRKTAKTPTRKASTGKCSSDARLSRELQDACIREAECRSIANEWRSKYEALADDNAKLRGIALQYRARLEEREPRLPGIRLAVFPEFTDAIQVFAHAQA